MTTLYFRGAGHLGPGDASAAETINFTTNGSIDSVAVGYATITDDDPCRASKLAMIAKYGPGLGIVAVDSIPPKASTVVVHPAPVFHVPTVADGWNPR
jgi:hypothetical protein